VLASHGRQPGIGLGHPVPGRVGLGPLPVEPLIPRTEQRGDDPGQRQVLQALDVTLLDRVGRP
jgi:hypothetical protein